MRPHVILNSAMSLDGKIGKKGEQIVFSNRLDNYRVNTLRGSVDAIMIDVDTVKKEDPELVAREIGEKKPIRVVVDKNAEIPMDARVLDEETETFIAVSKSAPRNRVDRLKKTEGVEVIVCGAHTANLDTLLSRLYDSGIKKVLLEGGGNLNRRMLNNDFVDEIFITIAPMLVGEGLDFFEGRLDENIHLTLEGILQYGDQVVLHYLVK